jgi:hypothetical protein
MAEKFSMDQLAYGALMLGTGEKKLRKQSRPRPITWIMLQVSKWVTLERLS